jgi:Fur family transcriptional regulator, ferric uptake regulator
LQKEKPLLGKELREAGLKVTMPRIKILKILEGLDQHHMSAENIYQMLMEQGEDVSLATVYRVLIQFEEVGLVKRHNFAGDYSIFELNQGQHHDHLVCIQCGKVAEFLDEVIEQHQQLVAKKMKFKMTEHSLTIYGICEECQNNY